MRINIVKSIFKKEMIDILRDKKTLFMTVILPIILYPLLMILATYVISTSSTSMTQKELNIAFSKVPDKEIMSKIEKLTIEEGPLHIVEIDDYKAALDKKEIAAYIEQEEKEGYTHYKIYINSSVEDNTEAANRIEGILEEYKKELVKTSLVDLGLDSQKILEPISYEEINIAENEQMVGYLLGNILPFILVMGILLGAIYPAIDAMAGEKERGTLETLLTLPISNFELVMGKYLAVSLSAVVTALLSILSILLSMVFLVLNMTAATEMANLSFDATQLILPLIITFICICIFAMSISAISLCICSLAKSFKEAENTATPVMIIAMVLSYSCMIPNISLNATTASIPVVNVVLLIKSVLTFRYNISLMALVLITNIVFVLIVVWVLSKLFNSEEVLFGNGKGFSFLEKRSNIKAGTMPTISDGIFVYGFTLLLLIYIGSYLQVKFKMLGIFASQIMLLSIPILLSIYIKTDFKRVYSIKRPKFKAIIGALFLWIGTYIFVSFVSNLLLYCFPQNQQVVEELNEALFVKDNIVINLLVVALTPAICEELMFRGYIFSAFKDKSAYKRGIIVSGILFGIMHIDFIRIIPTGCLGIVLAYAVYKSGSIFVGILIHFLNNGISVLALHYPNGRIVSLLETMDIHFDQIQWGNLLILIGIMIGSISLGVLLLKENKQKAPSQGNLLNVE